jgi:hypothetical protein
MDNASPLTRIVDSKDNGAGVRVAKSVATPTTRSNSLYPLVNLGSAPALQAVIGHAANLSLESHSSYGQLEEEPIMIAAADHDSPCSKLEDVDTHDGAYSYLDNDPDCHRDGSCADSP